MASTKMNMFMTPLQHITSTNKFVIGSGNGEYYGATAAEMVAALGITASIAELNSVADESARVVNLTANTVLTVAAHSNKIITFGDADGASLTLPAATGTGAIFRFVVAVTVTSVGDVIKVANATDEFHGFVTQADTDTGDAFVVYPALDGDGYDTITMDGSTTGGIMGDHFTIIDYAAGKFCLSGHINSTGTVATPLSAGVS